MVAIVEVINYQKAGVDSVSAVVNRTKIENSGGYITFSLLLNS